MSGTIRVMVVDDSPLVCRALSVGLEKAGFTVLTRTNPIGTGGAIVRERPDVVLLDLSMPALNGDEIVSSMASSAGRKRTRILLHSDRPESELSEVSARCGADGWLRKGTSVERIASRIRELLRDSLPPERRALVVEPDPVYRTRLAQSLGEVMKVALSDSGTEALVMIASASPPDVVVASTELVDLSIQTLAREAIRLDRRFRERFVLVRGRRGERMAALQGFEPPTFDRDAPMSDVRDAVLRAGRAP